MFGRVGVECQRYYRCCNCPRDARPLAAASRGFTSRHPHGRRGWRVLSTTNNNSVTEPRASMHWTRGGVGWGEGVRNAKAPMVVSRCNTSLAMGKGVRAPSPFTSCQQARLLEAPFSRHITGYVHVKTDRSASLLSDNENKKRQLHVVLLPAYQLDSNSPPQSERPLPWRQN